MMKIINPNYAPLPADRPLHDKHRAAVVAQITAMAATKRALEFSEIRTALPAIAAELPDGVLHQIAIDAGVKVEG